MRGYFLASVVLLIIGGIPFLLGLPYAVKHFGESRAYCCAMTTHSPSLDWVFGYDGTFQPFMPYALILLAVGGLFFLAYTVERKELSKEQNGDETKP